jgi:hypothetical protein
MLMNGRNKSIKGYCEVYIYTAVHLRREVELRP